MKQIFILCLFLSISFSFDFYESQINKIENHPLQGGFSKSELQEFHTETSFTITKASLYLNPIGGFADGKYLLDEVHIDQVSHNIYNVILSFKLQKKKYMSYKHSEKLSVLYDEKKFWVKFKNKVHKYKVPKLKLMKIIQQDKEMFLKKRDSLHIKLDNLNFVVEFNM